MLRPNLQLRELLSKTLLQLPPVFKKDQDQDKTRHTHKFAHVSHVVSLFRKTCSAADANAETAALNMHVEHTNVSTSGNHSQRCRNERLNSNTSTCPAFSAIASMPCARSAPALACALHISLRAHIVPTRTSTRAQAHARQDTTMASHSKTADTQPSRLERALTKCHTDTGLLSAPFPVSDVGLLLAPFPTPAHVSFALTKQQLMLIRSITLHRRKTPARQHLLTAASSHLKQRSAHAFE